jgi:hypothetical protein
MHPFLANPDVQLTPAVAEVIFDDLNHSREFQNQTLRLMNAIRCGGNQGRAYHMSELIISNPQPDQTDPDKVINDEYVVGRVFYVTDPKIAATMSAYLTDCNPQTSPPESP